MKIRHLLLTICSLLCISSCELMPAISWGWQDPATSILLTGENLASTQLSYNVPTDDDQVLSDRFTFSFTVDYSDCVKVKKNKGEQFNVVPSSELFSSFGSNMKAVMNEFDRIHKEVCDSYLSVYQSGRYSFNVITILYNGGMSLVCESEFAGHPAGENLASVITCFPWYDGLVEQSGEDPIIADGFNTPSNIGKSIEMPMEYISMIGGTIKFSIPKGDSELLHTGANFRLEIPVRVVDYLTWLNDKISDPDAEMPYRDEVLKCSFRTNWTLR